MSKIGGVLLRYGVMPGSFASVVPECVEVLHTLRGEILLTSKGIAARVNVLNREGDGRVPMDVLDHA